MTDADMGKAEIANISGLYLLMWIFVVNGYLVDVHIMWTVVRQMSTVADKQKRVLVVGRRRHHNSNLQLSVYLQHEVRF